MTSREVLKSYELYLNRRDFDALADLIAPDAVFWFSDGSHRGIAAIRAAFEATWRALPEETYWLDELEWLTEGDGAAACTYRFNWRAMRNGQPISGAGRGTTVLHHNGDRWQIVHEHLSLNPLAARH
jgi:ketosteroid isomerase-like protein